MLVGLVSFRVLALMLTLLIGLSPAGLLARRGRSALRPSLPW